MQVLAGDKVTADAEQHHCTRLASIERDTPLSNVSKRKKRGCSAILDGGRLGCVVFPAWIACGTGPSHWLIVDGLAALSRTLSWNYIAADMDVHI